MKLTLVGSARFEKEFKDWNRRLSLAHHVVYSLASYPSDATGKDGYTREQKYTLDDVSKLKIQYSDGVVLMGDGYIGKSTRNELSLATHLEKLVFLTHPEQRWSHGILCCTVEGCLNPLVNQVCDLCRGWCDQQESRDE